MTTTIMITTKNRAEDLRRTCRVLKKLNPSPIEILVTADGCTDHTVEMLSKELPEARLIINETGKGSVASRVGMMNVAKGDLILALDDDSYPEQMDCLGRIGPLFDENPRMAVAHFPQRTDEFPESLTQTDFGVPHQTRSFADSGAFIRRSIYQTLPGFEAGYYHTYEEPDFALQCVGAGYEVWMVPDIIIRHHFSGKNRNEVRNHHIHSRNEFWSTLMRCPFPYLPGLVAYRIFSQFCYACKRGGYWVVREPIWWLKTLPGIPYFLRKRNPISWDRYKIWLSLP